MGKPAARQGDMTAHGGVITVGAPTVLIGGLPAARVGDMHTCPMQTPAPVPVPHVGGPIMPPGGVTVLIAGMPAACVGDMALCTGPPDSIIPPGCPTVLIGQGGGGSGGAGSGGGSTGSGTSDVAEVEEGHYLDAKFVDKGGKPITGVSYKVTSPDNTEMRGALTGQVKKTGVKEGTYEIALKSVTKAQWSTDRAAVGDKVKLLVETAGVEDGKKAELEIFIKDANFADHALTTLHANIDGGKVEEEWELEIDDPLLEDQESKEGRAYSSPMFYFVVRTDGVSARSGLLVYRDYIELELTGDDDKPAKGVAYKVYLPNGLVRTGKLDDNGYAKEENIPPGKVEVVFDVREQDN